MTLMRWLLGLSIAAMLSLPAFATEDVSAAAIEALEAELKQAGTQYGEYYNSHDVDGIMTFIDQRSIVVDWHGRAAVGRDQVRAFFEKTFAENPALRMTSELEQAQFVDDSAVMTFGTLNFTGHGESWPDSSKFSVLWRKIGDHWVTYYDTGMIPMK